MFGAIISFFMGYFSDHYGRKTVCLLATLLMSLSIMINEILQFEWFNLDINSKYIVYSITQFLLGFCVSTNYYASFILLLEITSAKHITIVSNFYDYMYVFGEFLILVVSYFARNFHFINYFISFCSLMIFLLVAICIPESPRYLITKKKYKEAYSVLKKIAKVNENENNLKSYPEFEIIFSSDTIDHQIKIVDKNSSNNETSDLMLEKTSGEIEKNESTKVKQPNYLFRANRSHSLYNFLFKAKNHVLMTFLLSYIWIALSMIYFGVSLGAFRLISEFYLII